MGSFCSFCCGADDLPDEEMIDVEPLKSPAFSKAKPLRKPTPAYTLMDDCKKSKKKRRVKKTKVEKKGRFKSQAWIRIRSQMSLTGVDSTEADVSATRLWSDGAQYTRIEDIADKFILIRQLGRGSNSDVFQAVRCTGHSLFDARLTQQTIPDYTAHFTERCMRRFRAAAQSADSQRAHASHRRDYGREHGSDEKEDSKSAERSDAKAHAFMADGSSHDADTVTVVASEPTAFGRDETIDGMSPSASPSLPVEEEIAWRSSSRLSSTSSKSKSDSGSHHVFESGEYILRHMPHMYAVKRMSDDSEDNWNNFEAECRNLSLLDHPNVEYFVESFVDKNNLFIISQLCTGGELFDRVRKLKHFSEDYAAKVIRALMDALVYIHANDVTHNDIKAENVLFETPSHDSEPILIDFGLSTLVKDEEMFDTTCGTPFYMAPEVTRQWRYGWELKKGDMWSIGVLCFVLVTGRYPFKGKSPRKTVDLAATEHLRFPSALKLSQNCKDFISGLLRKRAKKRMSAAEALAHPWLHLEGSIDEHLGDEILSHLGFLYDKNILRKLVANELMEKMTLKHRRALIRMFRELDTSHRGFVTAEDFEAWLQSHSELSAEQISARTAVIMKQIDGEFEASDSKKETGIDMANFIKANAMDVLDHRHVERIRRLFADCYSVETRMFDTDKLLQHFEPILTDSQKRKLKRFIEEHSDECLEAVQSGASERFDAAAAASSSGSLVRSRTLSMRHFLEIVGIRKESADLSVSEILMSESGSFET